MTTREQCLLERVGVPGGDEFPECAAVQQFPESADAVGGNEHGIPCVKASRNTNPPHALGPG
jgi:hypothetical protein